MKLLDKVVPLLALLCQIATLHASPIALRLFWYNGDYKCELLRLTYEDEQVYDVKVGPSDSLYTHEFDKEEDVSHLKSVTIIWNRRTREFPITKELFNPTYVAENRVQLNVFLNY